MRRGSQADTEAVPGGNGRTERQYQERVDASEVVSSGQGVQQMSYTVHAKGEYLVYVCINGQAIAGSPFRVTGSSDRRLAYAHDLDENGLLFYIGSGGGQRPFRNPALSDCGGGRVSVEASSLYDGQVSPPARSAWRRWRRFLVCCCVDASVGGMRWADRMDASIDPPLVSALPPPPFSLSLSLSVSPLIAAQVTDPLSRLPANSYTRDEANSWWNIDIGARRRLIPTHYTLRNVSGCYSHALRTWRFEASADSKVWVTLRTHDNDTSIAAAPNASATWAISMPADSLRRHSQRQRQLRGDGRASGDGGQAAAGGAEGAAGGGGVGGAGEFDGFRYFCITQTAANSHGRHFLMLGGIELYGTLVEFSDSR